jgi:hypothetical protein
MINSPSSFIVAPRISTSFTPSKGIPINAG